MFDDLNRFIAPFFVAVTVFSSFCVFGYFMDDKIDHRYRTTSYELLARINKDLWPRLFLSLYDHVFRSSTNGRPQFRRSASATFVAMAIVGAVWFVHQPTVIEIFAREGWEYTWMILLVLLPFVIVINLVGDYFSFWETRIVLVGMTRTRSSLVRALLIVADMIASMAIYAVGLTLGLFLGPPVWEVFGVLVAPTGWELVGDVFHWVIFEHTLLLSNPDEIANFFGVLFYTTMSTSIWLWVYLCGLTVWPFLTFLRNVLDIKKHPVGALMAIGGAVMGVFVGAILFLGGSWEL